MERLRLMVGAAGDSVLVDRLLLKTPRATTRRARVVRKRFSALLMGPEPRRLPPRLLEAAGGDTSAAFAILAAVRGMRWETCGVLVPIPIGLFGGHACLPTYTKAAVPESSPFDLHNQTTTGTRGKVRRGIGARTRRASTAVTYLSSSV